MAYKKYITRDGKQYGPYIYENKRINGRVVTQYLGKGNRRESFLFTYITFAFLLLLLMVLFLQTYTDTFTGRASFGADDDKGKGDDDTSITTEDSSSSSGSSSSDSVSSRQADSASETISESVDMVEIITEDITEDSSISDIETVLEDVQDSFSIAQDNLETVISYAEKNPNSKTIQKKLEEAEEAVKRIETIEDSIILVIKKKIEKEEAFRKEIIEKTINRVEKRRNLVENDLSKKPPIVLSSDSIIETVKPLPTDELNPIVETTIEDFVSVAYEQKLATNRKVFVDWKIDVSISEDLPSDQDFSFALEPIHDKPLDLEIIESGSASVAYVENPEARQGLLGPVIDFVLGPESDSTKPQVTISEPKAGETYTFFYRTPAPKTEKIASQDKVTVSVTSELDYQEVVVEFLFDNLFEEYSGTLPEDVTAYKVYWIEEDRFVSDVNIYQDTDAEGNPQKFFQFIVPHTSNQTFEIIVITDAEHLDENRSFITNIYEEVFQLDEIWSEPIPENHYVRLAFEKNLTSTNDITVYPRTISGTPQLEVYEINGTEPIALFTNLVDNQYNKVYLTELQGEQDWFDLRVINGTVEFDHIIDPSDGAPDITFSASTPADDSTQSEDSIFVGLTTIDSSDHYSFVDFNEDVFLWMRMDDVNSSGDPQDLSKKGNNGALLGDSFTNSSGIFGSTAWFDGMDDSSLDQIVINTLDDQTNSNLFAESFSISVWAHTTTLGDYREIIGTRGLLATDGGWSLRKSITDKFEFAVANYTSVEIARSNASTASGSWHHIVGVYNHTTPSTTLYLDGVKEATEIGQTPTNGAQSPLGLRIGTITSTSGVWDGAIDEAILFNRAITINEALALYNSSAYSYGNNFTQLLEGPYIIQGFTADSLGQSNDTGVRNINVDKTDTEVHTYIYNRRANATVSTGSLVPISGNLFNSSGIIRLYIDGELVKNQHSPINHTAKLGSGGPYNITVIFPENATHGPAVETWWIYISTGNVEGNSSSGSSASITANDFSTHTSDGSPIVSEINVFDSLVSSEGSIIPPAPTRCESRCENIGDCRPANSFTPTVFTSRVVYPEKGIQAQLCSVICAGDAEPFTASKFIGCIPDEEEIEIDVDVDIEADESGSVETIILNDVDTDFVTEIDVTGDVVSDIVFSQDSEEPQLSPSTCHNAIHDGDETEIDCGGSCQECTVWTKRPFPWILWITILLLSLLFFYLEIRHHKHLSRKHNHRRR